MLPFSVSKRYCFRTPPFPSDGYVGLAFVENKEGYHILYPLPQIFSDIKYTYKNIINLKKELQDEQKATIYNAMIVKIKFHKPFPLRRQHWTNTPDTDRFNSLTRGTYFLKMLNDVHQFYQIMVLPAGYNVKTKKWNFVNWIPILITANADYIDGLVMDSDQAVNESANSMGMYLIEKVRGLDLETGKVLPLPKSTETTESNC